MSFKRYEYVHSGELVYRVPFIRVIFVNISTRYSSPKQPYRDTHIWKIQIFELHFILFSGASSQSRTKNWPHSSVYAWLSDFPVTQIFQHPPTHSMDLADARRLPAEIYGMT